MPAKTVETLIYELDVKDEASKVFDAWSKKILSAERLFSGLTKVAGKALDGVGKAFVDTVKDAQSFEDALIVARRTMGLTAQETDALGNAILDLGVEMGGISADSLAEIAGIAGTLGIRGIQNVTDFSEAIAQIGISTDLAASTAAAKIPAILTLYKVATDDMGQATKDFGNALNLLGNNMNATQSQILAVSSAIAGTLATSGFTTKEMLALSAAVATVEKRFGTAGSAIAQIMGRMSGDYAKFAEVLKIDSEELRQAIETNPVAAFKMLTAQLAKIKETEGVVGLQQALNDLGIRGVRAGDVLKKMTLAAGQFDKALKLVNDETAVNKSLDEETAIAMATLTKQWETFHNVIDNIQKFLGGPLLDALTFILQKGINPLVKSIYDWITASGTIETVFLPLLQEAQTYFVDLAGKALEFLKAIDWAQLIVQVKEFVQSIDFRAILAAVTNAAESLWNLLSDGGGAAAMAEKVAGAIDSIVPAIDAVTKAWKALTKVIEFFQKLTMPLFQLLVDGAFLFNDAVNGIISMFQKAGQAVDNFFQPFDASIRKAITTVVELGKKIINLIPGLNKVEETATGNSVFPDMVMWANKAASSVTGIGNSLNGLQGKLQNSQNQLNSLGAASGPVFSPAFAGLHGGFKLQSQLPQNTQTGGQQLMQQASTTNIIFQGQNIIDSTSQNRFTRSISKTQQNQRARTVPGSTRTVGRATR